MLDNATSSLVEGAAQAAGVSVLTGRCVASIDGSVLAGPGVSSVTLDDGTRLPCQMVIMAVGVRARTELASTQVRTRHGFIVEETMRTSVPDVFACGDATEVFDYVRGTEKSSCGVAQRSRQRDHCRGQHGRREPNIQRCHHAQCAALFRPVHWFGRRPGWPGRPMS